jgi:peptide/nickel transport system permease protein
MKRSVLLKSLGYLIAGALVFIALFGPLLVSADPNEQDLMAALSAPGRDHPLGTDHLGRSVFSRIVWGARNSLSLATMVVCLSCLIGTSLGFAAGYFGGVLDLAIMRIVDGAMAMPGIIMAIIIAGLFGGNPMTLVAALVFTGWCDYCRLTRNMVRQIVQAPYIEASRLLGLRPFFIIRRYLVRETSGQLLNLASLKTGHALLNISALGFLGIGLRPPNAEWGAMITQAMPYLAEAPYLVLAPGAAIFLAVLGFHLSTDMAREGVN